MQNQTLLFPDNVFHTIDKYITTDDLVDIQSKLCKKYRLQMKDILKEKSNELKLEANQLMKIKKPKFIEIIKMYSKAIQICPNQFENEISILHNNLGMALKKQGEPLKAQKQFSNAIDINENYLKPRYHRMLLSKQEYQFKNALADAYKIIQIDPNFQAAEMSLLMPDIMQTYLHSKNQGTFNNLLRIPCETCKIDNSKITCQNCHIIYCCSEKHDKYKSSYHNKFCDSYRNIQMNTVQYNDVISTKKFNKTDPDYELFECKICKVIFDYHSALIFHTVVFHNAFYCIICTLQIESRRVYDKHLEKLDHGHAIYYKMSDIVQSQIQGYQRYYNQVEGSQNCDCGKQDIVPSHYKMKLCDGCEAIYECKGRYQGHLVNGRCPRNKQVTCPICLEDLYCKQDRPSEKKVVTYLSCSHATHEKCFGKYAMQVVKDEVSVENPELLINCPICQQPVKYCD